MSGLSEAELHVQAMRLVCEALQDREKTGLEVDWDVLCHMHDHMDVIFRGIEDQRRDDQDELMHTRKDRDHWRQARQDAHEAIETLRQQLADAQRAVSDAFAEVNSVRQQLDAALAEIVDVRRQRNRETDRLNATNAVSVQQRDEIAYLRTRLDEERSVSAGLLRLAEAQPPDVDAMRVFVDKVRACVWACYEWPQSWHKIEAALVELDAELIDAEGGA
jgi:small-conductance mechanosensitive channel